MHTVREAEIRLRTWGLDLSPPRQHVLSQIDNHHHCGGRSERGTHRDGGRGGSGGRTHPLMKRRAIDMSEDGPPVRRAPRTPCLPPARGAVQRYGGARIIDEAALRRPLGDAEVMRKQGEYLLRVGQLPHIDLQVLPFSVGAHAALGSAFTVLDFLGAVDPTIIFTDSIGGGLFEESPEEVDQYVAIFGDVQGSA
ncbi:hypothetical protein EKD16_21890 [Streptomonospora litoralis]|uniref:DUF5753 domain-containing protein n=2 Tax=Streptomonospora litoralis TaxID=2498135 RepID=A0A4P6Q963_9ACTN|nr:hypothetical protein EKD16_21890 [Streptomonospora litoralis]